MTYALHINVEVTMKVVHNLLKLAYYFRQFG